MIPCDKQLHLLGGSLVALAVALLTWPHAFWPVALAPAFVGILKEANDFRLNQAAAKAGLLAPHGVELMDAVCTAIPGFLAAALIYFLEN